MMENPLDNGHPLFKSFVATMDFPANCNENTNEDYHNADGKELIH
jgi:hypothetical protein